MHHITTRHLWVNFVDLDPREERERERLSVQIRSLEFHSSNIGPFIIEAEEEYLVSLIWKNIYLFACNPSDMSRNDIRVVCHHLFINSPMNLVARRKCKVGRKSKRSLMKKLENLKYPIL